MMLNALRSGSKGLKMGSRLQHSGLAQDTPKMMKASVEAYSEGPTTLIRHGSYKFVIDEPPKLGGRGLGANPLSHMLGALIGCTSYTLEMVTKEMKLPTLERIQWHATGSYDLRGLQGVEGTDARFQEILVQATIDGDVSNEDLQKLASQVEKRCIVAATCAASGMKMELNLKKGAVDHDCQPACELHDLENQKGVIGKVSGNSGKEGDSPQFAGTQGHGAAKARAYHTSAALFWAVNGEDVAREHLGAKEEPQIQKEQSEKGAPETAGGAYASRDAPRAQAAPPTEGKSDEELVQKQTAGATTKPEESASKDDEIPPPPPGFADKAVEASRHGESPLGNQPHGDE